MKTKIEFNKERAAVIKKRILPPPRPHAVIAITVVPGLFLWAGN